MNSETRKLIKRSSRKGELKKKFKVNEMSSISTLELRGRINRCGRVTGAKRYFLLEVAYTNKLELLKWAREEKKCEWDEWTINAAARQGNLEMVKYCVANECPIDEWRVQMLPKRSSRVPQILTRRSESALGLETAAWAAENGHLHILEYLVERKYDKYSECVCMMRPRTAT